MQAICRGKLRTGIPIRIVNELLYELTQINIITEISSGDKGETTYYQPAICLTRLTVGTLIDRLEANGKWALSIDMRKLASPVWKKAYANRSNYLNKQREILVKDL